MKKFLALLVIFAVVLLGAIGLSLDKDRADQVLDKTWVLSQTDLDTIRLAAFKQSAKVVVSRGSKTETTVQVRGLVSKETLDNLEQTAEVGRDFNLVLSQKGFHMVLNDLGKEPLEVLIELGEETRFNLLEIKSLIGQVTLVLPEDYEGQYQLLARDGGEVLEQPANGLDTSSLVQISSSGDIRVRKE